MLNKKDPSLPAHDKKSTLNKLTDVSEVITTSTLRIQRALLKTTLLNDKYTKRCKLCWENECRRFDSHKSLSREGDISLQDTENSSLLPFLHLKEYLRWDWTGHFQMFWTQAETNDLSTCTSAAIWGKAYICALRRLQQAPNPSWHT